MPWVYAVTEDPTYLDAITSQLDADPTISWVRIGAVDTTKRRSMWVRIEMFDGLQDLDPRPEYSRQTVKAIRIRAGREGRDVEMRINQDDPRFGEFLDLFTCAVFAATT